MNIYQIEQEQNQLADLVLESGEITDEQNQILASWIEDTEKALGEKIDAYLNLAAECEGLDAIGKEEAAKISKRRHAATALRERLRKVLMNYFERNIITGKIQTPQGRRVGVENCAASLEIDEQAVPQEYLEAHIVVPYAYYSASETAEAYSGSAKIAFVVDREKIKAAMKAGIEVPGCKYTGGRRLAVR